MLKLEECEVTWKRGRLFPYKLARYQGRIFRTNGPKLRIQKTRIQNIL